MSDACEDTRSHQALDALFVGELDDAGLTRLRAHAQQCPACREQYDRITRAEAAVDKTGGALPQSRQRHLEAALLARTAAADRAEAAERHPETPRGARFWRWLLPTFGALSAGAVALVLLLPDQVHRTQQDGFQARGSAVAPDTFGVRAFCIVPGEPPRLTGSANPGGELSCPPGSALTFSYTAPRPARLSIDAVGSATSHQLMLPDDPLGQVKAAVDEPLAFSTPVTAEWLNEPMRVKAKFVDPRSGAVVGETEISLKP